MKIFTINTFFICNNIYLCRLKTSEVMDGKLEKERAEQNKLVGKSEGWLQGVVLVEGGCWIGENTMELLAKGDF